MSGRRKRLLLVANPFPPMASGGNARLVRFCRHLPAHGWDVTVLTAMAEGPVEIPSGLQIVRTRALTPDPAYAAAKRGAQAARAARAWLRGGRSRRPEHKAPSPPAARSAGGRQALNDWLFLPDSYVGWIPGAVRAGRRLMAAGSYDAIMSSHPRASTELVAAALAHSSGRPWLADYRDPWTTNELRRFATRLHRKAHERTETAALRRASRVTAVNDIILHNLQRRFPFLEGRGEVITNGYDPDESADAVDLGRGFWFVHTGRLYRRMEELTAFLEAFAGLPDETRILFLGIQGTKVRAEAERLGISDRVRVEPFAAHSYALGCQRAADALLLLTVAKLESLTGKVFEYLASGKPVFAVTPAGSSAQLLLERAGLSACAPPDRPMQEALTAFFGAARGGTLAPRVSSVVAEYSAETLTARLAALLDEMTG